MLFRSSEAIHGVRFAYGEHGRQMHEQARDVWQEFSDALVAFVALGARLVVRLGGAVATSGPSARPRIARTCPTLPTALRCSTSAFAAAAR